MSDNLAIFDGKISARQSRLRGFRDAFGVPAIALYCTMVGFGAVARENGLDAVQTILTTMLVWGMPGQVAFAQLYGAGGGALVIFTAVALANMRMLPMTISGLPLMRIHLHNFGFLTRASVAHFIAVTGWAQLTLAEQKEDPKNLLSYFLGFTATIYIAALLGTATGYFIAGNAPEPLVKVVIYVTPLYILMLVMSARQATNRQAVFLGAAIGPLTYPFLGDWCLLAAGAGGGALGMIKHQVAKRAKKEDAS